MDGPLSGLNLEISFFNLDFILCVIILMTPVEIHFMIPDIFMVFSQCIKEIDAFILSFLHPMERICNLYLLPNHQTPG